MPEKGLPFSYGYGGLPSQENIGMLHRKENQTARLGSIGQNDMECDDKGVGMMWILTRYSFDSEKGTVAIRWVDNKNTKRTKLSCLRHRDV
jgi:hypothetical protein